MIRASGSLQDNQKRSFVESPSRDGDTAQESYIETSLANPLYVASDNISPFGKYDTITATYPTALIEVYTYSLSASDIGTVTVTYEDTKKKVLLSVVKNAI